MALVLAVAICYRGCEVFLLNFFHAEEHLGKIPLSDRFEFFIAFPHTGFVRDRLEPENDARPVHNDRITGLSPEMGRATSLYFLEQSRTPQ